MSRLDEGRAIRALTDVVAVEYDEEAEMYRVVTWSDVYHAIPEEGQHLCPDRKHNDIDLCKHLIAVEVARGRIDIDVPEPFIVTDDLDQGPEPLPDFEDFEAGAEVEYA